MGTSNRSATVPATRTERAVFNARGERLGIEQFLISPRSPWQNGYAERFVGTLRRELLDHLIVWSERQLLTAVRAYIDYYNNDRPHMSLESDAPTGRSVEEPSDGKIVSLPKVGGLHHRYLRVA